MYNVLTCTKFKSTPESQFLLPLPRLTQNQNEPGMRRVKSTSLPRVSRISESNSGLMGRQARGLPRNQCLLCFWRREALWAFEAARAARKLCCLMGEESDERGDHSHQRTEGRSFPWVLRLLPPPSGRPWRLELTGSGLLHATPCLCFFHSFRLFHTAVFSVLVQEELPTPSHPVQNLTLVEFPFETKSRKPHTIVIFHDRFLVRMVSLVLDLKI